MSTEPIPSNTPSPPPQEQDITPAERDALLLGTLRSLQDAFSASGDVEDADTHTELNQSAADAASEATEEPE